MSRLPYATTRRRRSCGRSSVQVRVSAALMRTQSVCFPDRVKGGAHPTPHRRVSIPLIIDDCCGAVAGSSTSRSCAHRALGHGDLAGARDLIEQVLEVFTRILGPEHPDTLTTMNDLATTLWDQGDLRALGTSRSRPSRRPPGPSARSTPIRSSPGTTWPSSLRRWTRRVRIPPNDCCNCHQLRYGTTSPRLNRHRLVVDSRVSRVTF